MRWDKLLAQEVFEFIFIFTRLSGAFLFMPVFASNYISRRIRLLFAVILALMLMPVLSKLLPAMPGNVLELARLLVIEATVGLFLGLFPYFLLSALDLVGTAASQATGFSNAMAFDPTTSVQSTLLTTFLTLTGLVLIVITDTHYIMLGSLIASYDLFPPGQSLLTGDMSQQLASGLSRAFLYGFQIGSPFIIMTVLLYSSMGVMSRLMPQLNIMFVVMPLQVYLGLALLMISLSMMMMQGLVNSYGKVLVAGYTAATKIDTLAMLPNMNFSNAMSSYTAQNIGAGKYERVKEGLKASLFMVVVFSLTITVLIFLFGNQLLGLFLDPGDTSGALGYGLAYMHTVSVFYILMGLLFVPNGMLRGAGDMGAFTFSSMANLFSRVAIAYALAYLTPLGANAIWWSIPAGWAIGATVSLLRVKSGKWIKLNI